MMPPAAVFVMAPANVLQGAVRLQGLTSSPTPDTQVRAACALAAELNANTTIRARRARKTPAVFMSVSSLCLQSVIHRFSAHPRAESMLREREKGSALLEKKAARALPGGLFFFRAL